jgi:hypothetical protein
MTEATIANISDLLDSVELEKTRLALETRGTTTSKLPAKLVKAMQDHDVIHCVDLSKGETPAYESNVLYSRLFGKGNHNIYQPADEELAEVDRVASNSKAEKMVMSFHFVRMYKDAARLKVYKQTGKFPQVTGSTGLSSLEEVLSEDASFPITKQGLVHSQGWKLFDLNQTVRTRAETFLEKLPEGTYSNVSEVIRELQALEG